MKKWTIFICKNLHIYSYKKNAFPAFFYYLRSLHDRKDMLPKKASNSMGTLGSAMMIKSIHSITARSLWGFGKSHDTPAVEFPSGNSNIDQAYNRPRGQCLSPPSGPDSRPHLKPSVHQSNKVPRCLGKGPDYGALFCN